jgi:hypothetical protein
MYNASTLQAIHASLNISDRLTALIRKQRLIEYPAGTSYAGKLNLCEAYAILTLSRC